MDDLNYDDLDPGIRRTVRWLRSLGYSIDIGDSEIRAADIYGKHVVTSSLLVMHSEPAALVRSAEALTGSLKLMLEDGDLLEAHQEENSGVFLSAIFDPVGWRARIELYNLDDSFLPPGVGEA